MEEDKIIDEEIVEEGGLSDKLKKLREELKVCRKEKGEYLAGWQRAKADFINARKDEEKARAEFAKFAAEKVLIEMLAVADSLELALGREDLPSEASASFQQIHGQLLGILKTNGVVPIESVGGFDPLYHEAIEQVEVSEEEKDGIVLEELQKGYKLYDRVLRPAKVKVGIYKNDNQ